MYVVIDADRHCHRYPFRSFRVFPSACTVYSVSTLCALLAHCGSRLAFFCRVARSDVSLELGKKNSRTISSR